MKFKSNFALEAQLSDNNIQAAMVNWSDFQSCYYMDKALSYRAGLKLYTLLKFYPNSFICFDLRASPLLKDLVNARMD